MTGTKRLCVNGPWHGHLVEPESDNYTSIRAELTGSLRLQSGETHVDYVPGRVAVPTVTGAMAPMPVLSPAGYPAPSLIEAIDALILLAWGSPATDERDAQIETSGLLGADGQPL